MDMRDLANYGGLLIGILGIILSFYLYKKGQETKSPRCFYKTYKNISKLADENDSKIKIFYDQKEVTRVFTTYVWIWNNGKKPINKSDIPSQSNITITLSDDEFSPEILDYQIIKTSRDAINFSVSRNSETSLKIAFDFLDQDDGAILEIQHKGSGETELVIDGIILGAPDGVKLMESKKKKSTFGRIISYGISLLDFKKYPNRFVAFVTLAIILFAVMTVFQYYEMKTNLSVSVTASKLQEVLVTEFPQLTEQSISNIMAKISEKSILAIQIFFIYMVGNILLLGGMLIYFVWRYSVLPYPKSLKLGDDFIKYERA